MEMNWKAAVGIGLVVALLAFGFLAVQNGETIVKVVNTTVLDGSGNGTVGGPHPPDIPEGAWIISSDMEPTNGPHPPDDPVGSW
jgi:hypothetical protein